VSPVTRFLRFSYDFVVGDDWTIALGVVIALAATVLLARTGVPAWWLTPAAVTLVLGASLWRATRHRR
jgi:uncharacterized membrane protein YccC